MPAILALSLACANISTAQVLRRDTIEPKKQVEVIRFGDDDEPSDKSSVRGLGIIKTAPLTFILGYVPVFYEREVADWLGIQAGAGITFKPAVSNIQSELYGEIFQNNCDGVDCGNYYDYSYRKGKIGYLFSLSPRLYFGSDGLEESYIAPELRYYRRRSDAQRPDPNSSFELVRLEDEYDAESYSFTDFMVHYGWQALYPKLSLDISVGVGIRKINGNWQEVYQDEFGFYYSETPEHSESRFRFDVGLRVGFQL